MHRIEDRGLLIVPAESGEPVEVRVQGYALRADAGPDGAEFRLPALFFGNRTEIRGGIWKGKAMTRLKVERR